ncbi:MAG: hypothetical protein IKN53_02355, partial [Oscillibacter sp.]|nr:hypothetical protein [Oscillibacter sp.]
LTYGEELLAVLAGPLANLLAALAFAASGRTLAAGAHGVLCAFNLLPIRPLDGGRALFLFLSFCFGPTAAERGCRVAGTVFSLALLAAVVAVMAESGGSLWLLPAAAGAFSALAREALPEECKISRIFVK